MTGNYRNICVCDLDDIKGNIYSSNKDKLDTAMIFSLDEYLMYNTLNSQNKLSKI